MNARSVEGPSRLAGFIDVRRILGDLDDAKIIAILAMKPSLADLEDAAVCLAGDEDIVTESGHHVPTTAARIIELIAEDEEQEPER